MKFVEAPGDGDDLRADQTLQPVVASPLLLDVVDYRVAMFILSLNADRGEDVVDEFLVHTVGQND